MIRSTCLTDYIKFGEDTQALNLINPAGFFMKYLMPTALPASIKTSETVSLEKGYYHGIIFDIPGAEVLINGEWTPYNTNNAALIKAQNPMTLEWRLNADLLRKLGYKQGDTVAGRILVVDDQWNGLNITKDISLQVK